MHSTSTQMKFSSQKSIDVRNNLTINVKEATTVSEFTKKLDHVDLTLYCISAPQIMLTRSASCYALLKIAEFTPQQ